MCAIDGCSCEFLLPNGCLKDTWRCRSFFCQRGRLALPSRRSASGPNTGLSASLLAGLAGRVSIVRCMSAVYLCAVVARIFLHELASTTSSCSSDSLINL